MPVMPQNAAGWRMEPPVSVPVAAGARRADTAAALPPDEQAVAAEAVDWEALRPLIAQLRALLEDSDAEALDLLEANGKALHAAFGPAYRKIEKCVRDFDFEAGLEALNAAAAARAG